MSTARSVAMKGVKHLCSPQRIASVLILTMVVVFVPRESLGMGGPNFGHLAVFAGVTTSLMQFNDDKSRESAAGLDVNMAFLVFNGGVQIREWHDKTKGWGEEEDDNEITGYLGVGIGGLIQAQLGYSGSRASLRLRSDIVFSDNAPLYGTKTSKRSWTLTPFIEMSPWSSYKRTVYGLGVGASF